ncbi:CPBP family intramembrane glutamic endopeptidase [Corallococcus sp. AB049A]|uniref:CPBP family intramembrane glutamic endopeptidase n=1 Tax=Corallococcus sp. AB049A TaxID=2316721 RepID=UPI0013156B35|nr:CPBP family intramembrane glutamic endopeptidase [Corallococcus sp. AB049A]
MKPRRLAFSTTSVSLTRASSTTGFIVPAWVALHTKLLGTDCLTHLGREGWGRTAGIAGAATLFGIMHLDYAYSPMAVFLGLFLGWLAERTGSVRLPIFVHVLNNLTSFLLSRYAPSTTELPTSVHVTLLAACSLVFVGVVAVLRRMEPRSQEPELTFSAK